MFGLFCKEIFIDFGQSLDFLIGKATSSSFPPETSMQSLLTHWVKLFKRYFLRDFRVYFFLKIGMSDLWFMVPCKPLYLIKIRKLSFFRILALSCIVSVAWIRKSLIEEKKHIKNEEFSRKNQDISYGKNKVWNRTCVQNIFCLQYIKLGETVTPVVSMLAQEGPITSESLAEDTEKVLEEITR